MIRTIIIVFHLLFSFQLNSQIFPFGKVGLGVSYTETKYLETTNYSGSVFSPELSFGGVFELGKIFDIEMEVSALRAGHKYSIRDFFDQYEVTAKLINYYLSYSVNTKFCFSCNSNLKKRNKKPNNRMYLSLGTKVGALINTKWTYANILENPHLSNRFQFDLIAGISYEKWKNDDFWGMGIRYFYGLNNVIIQPFGYNVYLRRIDVFIARSI